MKASLSLCLTFLLALSAHVAYGDYTLQVSGDSVTVKLSSEFRQALPIPNVDITNYITSFPVLSVTLVGANASFLKDILQTALGKPGLVVAEPLLTASSNGTWISLDLQFNVSGIAKRERGMLQIDLSWKDFQIPTDIIANGFSINLVGEKYLGPSIDLLADPTPFPGHSWIYLLNGRSRTSTEIKSDARSLILADLSSFSAPLSTWEASFDFSTKVTEWKAHGSFNITIVHTILEARDEPPIRIGFTAIYSPSASVAVPSQANVVGDTVLISTSGTEDLILIAVPTASFSVLLGSLVAERLLQGRGRTFPKRRKK